MSECVAVAVTGDDSCNGQNETLRRFIIIFYPRCFVYGIMLSFAVASKGLDKTHTQTQKNYELNEQASLCSRTT